MEPDGLGLTHAFVSLIAALGYLMMVVMVLPFLPLTRHLRQVGTVLFAAAAISAASMVLRVEHTWFIVAVDAVQAAALLWFLVGTWEHLRAPAEDDD